jgi:hypothetical protein
VGEVVRLAAADEVPVDDQRRVESVTRTSSQIQRRSQAIVELLLHCGRKRSQHLIDRIGVHCHQQQAGDDRVAN